MPTYRMRIRVAVEDVIIDVEGESMKAVWADRERHAAEADITPVITGRFADYIETTPGILEEPT